MLPLDDMRVKDYCLAAGLLFLTACTSTTSSTAPQPQSQQVNLTGTWSGNLVLQGTTSRMTWTLTQRGTSVIGPALVAQPNGVVLFNGAVSGTVSGTTFTYTISVTPGGIPSVPSCSGQLAGTAAWASGANPTLTGSYAVAMAACNTSQLTGGNFTLTRQ